MSKQHRNNSSAKQETQLKNRNIGVIAGVLILSFIIIGTLSFNDNFEENPEIEALNSRINHEEENREEEPLDLAIDPDQVLDEDISRVMIEEEEVMDNSPETVIQRSIEKSQKEAAKPQSPQAKNSVTSSVQWAGMNASIEGGDAVIKWTTLQEQNTAFFEIERSIDEESFEKIGKLEGKDLTSYNERNYVFSDSSLKFVGMPRIYYKINQVGLDGKTHSSEIYEYDLGLNLDLYIRVEEIKDGILTVSYAGDEEGKANVGVMTPSGKILYDEEVEVGFTPRKRKMNASLWGEGVYLLVLYDKKTRVTEMLEITN